MKKDKLIVLFASLVTVILGPGAGHLIIKEWKKAALFISLALGFSSQSAFISVFKKINGITPKKYREEHYMNKIT